MSTPKGEGISVSFSYTTSPDEGRQPQRLWAFDVSYAYPLSGTEYLVRSRRNGRTTVVTKDVLDTLGLCTRFRTLDDHVAAITEAVPALGDSAGEVRKVLTQLTASGLMRDAAGFVEALRETGSAPPPSDPPRVVIRTCDRPGQLGRLLDSLAENEARFAGGYRYLVLDDSRNADNARENARLAAGFRERTGRDTRYWGERERQALIDHLRAGMGAAAGPVVWLIEGDGSGPTYGRSWNQALLLTAGERAVLIDDDCICRPRRPPVDGKAVQFGGRQEAVFYADRDAVFGETADAGIDPIAAHAATLGGGLGHILREVHGAGLAAETVAGLTAEEAYRLEDAGPVVMTTNGIVGDPGTDGFSWLYDLDAAGRDRLCRSESDYRRHIRERSLWLGPAALRIVTDGYLLTTTATGIDNTRLLPPTYPILRNEDALFGAALRFLYPGAVVAQLPWGLPHRPEPPRDWEQAALDRPATPNVLQFMADAALNAAHGHRAAAPATRLDELAVLFRDLADADEQALLDYVNEYVVSIRSDWVQRIDRRIREADGTPGYWAADARRVANANAQSILSGPPGLRLGGEPEDGDAERRHLRDCLAGYAESVRLWGRAREICRGSSLLSSAGASG